MTRPLVSIVIPCYNGAKRLPGLIDGLMRTEYDPFEVLVVDNTSTDDTAQVAASCLREAPFGSRVVRRQADHMLGAARNAGFRESRGEFVVFVDDDVRVPSPGWLAAFTDFMISHPDAGMAGPAVLDPDGQTLQFGGMHGRFHAFFRNPLRGVGYASISKDPLRVDSLVGPILMGRRSTLLAVGPWDEHFDPIMFEETDMLWRISNLGQAIYWVPAVSVIHEGRLSFQRHPEEYVLSGFAKHCLRSILKNASGPMIPPELAYAVVVIIGFHPERGPRILLKAMAWNLKNLEDTRRERGFARSPPGTRNRWGEAA